MSKHLIKILSFCALIVLVPLIVVGTALCVTEASPATLTIYEGGKESTYGGTNSELLISIDGVPQVDENNDALTSVTVKKNTEVTVSFTGTGYDFVGWYNGNPQEIDSTKTAVYTNPSYTFTIRKSTVLTAIRDVLQYQIQYTGLYDNGAEVGSVESDYVSTEVQVVEYNQPLSLLSSQVGATFDGWYVYSGQEDNVTGTKVANFNVENRDASGKLVTLTLRPVWSNQMVIQYYDMNKTNVIAQDYVTPVTFANYELRAQDDDAVVNALNKTGYQFEGWTDIAGEEIILSNIEFKIGELAIYMSVKPIDYNINVKFNALSEQTDFVAFNVESGFGQYTVNREGYNFVGFSYDGITYQLLGNDYVANGETLSSKVLENNGELTITAVWECLYPDIAWEISFSYEQLDGEISGVYYYDGTTYQPIQNKGGDDIIFFEDIVDIYYAQLEEVILERYFGDIDLNSIYSYVNGEYQKVTLSQIWIYDDINPMLPSLVIDSYDIMANQTFKDIFDSKYFDGSIPDVNKLVVRFMFA